MSNFKSTSLVKTQSPIVLSFDITQRTKKYYFGFSLTDEDESQITQQLRIAKGSIEHYFQGQKSYEFDEVTNTTSLYNTNGKLFNNDLIILQSPQIVQYYISTEPLPDGGLDYIIKFDKNDTESLKLESLNLGYKSYISSKDFFNQKTLEQIYNNNQVYYGTPFNVIPVLYCQEFSSEPTNQEEESYIILVQNNTNDVSFLATDFAIEIPNNYAKFTTINAVQYTTEQGGKIKSNILSTDVVKKEFDKVRFVISDYGRIMSHSVQYKNKPQVYQQTSYIVFDSNKLQKPISIRFGVDNIGSISNVTSNF